MDHDRLARALRAPSAGPVTRRTPIAIAVGLALAGGMPAAQAGAPAPGAALGNEFQVNTQISSFQRQSAAAMDAAGDFVVTWTDYGGEDGDSSGIFAQRYHADGTPAGTEFRVNTHTSGGQARPAVAMDAAGNFVVTWTDYSAEDGDSFGVFGQHYHADGTPDGAEFKVNTQTAGKQHRPAVAMDGAGDFVVTWMGDDGSAYGVFAQRYRADGTPDGTEFLVNTNTVNSQREAAVAMDAAGDFVVSWTDHSGEDGDAFGIFAQRFHADGTPNGAEFQVNTHFAGDQDVSTVAMDAAGGFVVSWTDYTAEDGLASGVFAQRYKADGSPAGAEFQVNTHTFNSQKSPAAAMDAAGDFVVSWTDGSSEDGDSYGIFAQRYKADGTPDGTEFQVNTHTAGVQTDPGVAMDAAGEVVVAWTDYSGEDGDGDGIFAQRYARESSLDLASTLAVAPADAVEPDDGLTLTVAIDNTETPSTLTGNATIDGALTAASGLTATLTLPDGVAFGSATGTNWTCPASPTGNTLICTYGASLGAASSTENLVVNLTAPGSAGVNLAFGSAVFGGQPDTDTDNDTASASIVTDNAPVATNASLTLNEGATGSGTLKATDADGDSLTFGEAGAPAHGSVKIDADGSYTYTPAAGYSGADSFTFKANDGKLDSNAATVSITVKATQGSTSDDDTDGSSPPPSQPGSSSGGGGGAFGWLAGFGLLELIRRRRRG